MKIPQFAPWIDQEEYKQIKTCFDTNWITEGPLSEIFRNKLLKMMSVKYGVFTNNGTSALFLGLKALGIGIGDEVIVPDFTYFGSATAVNLCGAVPVFADVNRKNFQIDARLAEKVITKKTRAIMPVHMYGTVADMKSVLKLARKYHLAVIEDAAQAIGVHREGKHAGTWGDVGCFSFFADKTITTAEGGFVVTNSEKLYTKLRYLRNQGRIKSGSFIHPKIGYNFLFSDIQSAIGLAQLRKLPQIKKRKLRILQQYKEELKGVNQITFFAPDKSAEWLPFRVAILAKNACHLMKFMKQKGIEPRTFFYPLHKQPAFNYLRKDPRYKNNLQDKNFPNSIYAYKHGVCLPTFSNITINQIKYVVSKIKEFYS